jgi:hypothetical protein
VCKYVFKTLFRWVGKVVRFFISAVRILFTLIAVLVVVIIPNLLIAPVAAASKKSKMSFDSVALLFGLVGVVATGVAVFALYMSATSAAQKIADETARAEKLAKEAEELRAKNLAVEAAISPRILEQCLF